MSDIELTRPQFGTPAERSRATALTVDGYQLNIERDARGKIVGASGRTRYDDLADRIDRLEGSQGAGLAHLRVNVTNAQAVARSLGVRRLLEFVWSDVPSTFTVNDAATGRYVVVLQEGGHPEDAQRALLFGLAGCGATSLAMTSRRLLMRSLTNFSRRNARWSARSNTCRW